LSEFEQNLVCERASYCIKMTRAKTYVIEGDKLINWYLKKKLDHTCTILSSHNKNVCKEEGKVKLMCCQDEANTIKLKLESRCVKPVWECGYGCFSKCFSLENASKWYLFIF
jgi:hypothetical protein